MKVSSIRHKIFAGVLFTTISALLISGVSIIAYELRDYHQRLVEDLTTQGNLLGLANAPALQFNDPKLAKDSLSSLEAKPQIIAAAIYTAEGKLFASYSNSAYDGERFPLTTESDGYRVVDNSLMVFQSIVDHGEALGALYIKAHYQVYERIWQYAGIVFLVMLLALIISMVLSLWMQRKITEPILKITEVARRITSERNYNLRAEKNTDDEISYLVDAFNNLLTEVAARREAIEKSNQQLQRQIVEREAAEEKILLLNAQLEFRVEERTAELERANKELEAFSYSVSHDLRTPLRAIDGFSLALLEDCGDQLDETGRDYLARVRSGAQRMGILIDDLLRLARVSRTSLKKELIDLSAMAEELLNDLRLDNPDRAVDVKVSPDIKASGDPHLMSIALENLLNNAWKYTGKSHQPSIEVNCCCRDGETCYFVKDNGAGFDMQYAGKLFGTFQRLHDAKEFAGTGVGLATVQRIIHRHGGKIWAESEIGKGATFYFTLPIEQGESDECQTNSTG